MPNPSIVFRGTVDHPLVVVIERIKIDMYACPVPQKHYFSILGQNYQNYIGMEVAVGSNKSRTRDPFLLGGEY